MFFQAFGISLIIHASWDIVTNKLLEAKTLYAPRNKNKVLLLR
jgi:hypothetical protein